MPNCLPQGKRKRIASAWISTLLVVLACSLTARGAMTAPVSFSSAGPLRFAQISDVHLFDAGYKCSGLYVQREYEENLKALQWTIDEINRRWKSGDKVDFLIFTGDLGIVNLTGTPATHTPPDANSQCSDAGDPSSSYGPIPQMDFATAEAVIAKLLDSLPPAVPVYFLPGNNDLTDEDPGTLNRYEMFLSGLRTLTHGRAVDLNEQGATARGYTLVGLDSAGFKPQSYTDLTSGVIDETAVVSRGTNSSGPQSFYCNELKGGSGNRVDAKAKAIAAFSSLVHGPGPYLVFTHEPDLQDPYLPRRQDEKASGGTCEFRSTWLLTDDARSAWMANGLDNPKVVGIFAGHFHDDNPAHYGGPLINPAVEFIYTAGAGKALVPTFVTPPLAVKLQWKNYPNGARGMMFVAVDNGKVNAQVDPYWSSLASDCCGAVGTKLVARLLTRLKASPGYVFVIALFLTVFLLLIVLWLASELDPHCQPISETPVGAFPGLRNRIACVRNTALKLIIDGETQTYSLSKFQFLLWTFATIYGYTYLWFAHTWVQGLPGLPDIAGQFPWAISLSAGTAVASQISTRVVGTKGGGPLNPQLSDLISAGGVVAPGRLQFFSWTLVAIAAYLSSILASDPCTVQTLPMIPPNLLIVSGLSSLAYLGARAVSSPGPVVASVSYKPLPPPAAGAADAPATPPAGTLTLLGSGFSKLAVVVLVMDPASIPGPANEAPSNLPQLDMSKSDVTVTAPPYRVDPSFATPGNADYSTRLDIGVLSGLDTKLTYRVRVTNPDGKYGEGESSTRTGTK
jgi:hypothetical protein